MMPSGLRTRVSAWVEGRFRALLRRSPIGPDGMARVRPREIYILPTGTGITYGLVTLATLIGSLNYQNNLGLLFTFFGASVGLVAMHHCWFNLLGLAVRARPGEPVLAGDPAALEVVLDNARRWERHDLAVTAGGAWSGAASVPARDRKAVTLSVATSRRGLLPVLEVQVETRYPMGLFRAWCLARSDAAVLVYPRPAASAPTPTGEGGDLGQPASAGREGNEDFLGTRGYRAGDSPRQLDWKAWARERGLVTKEFGGSDGAEVWLDWWQLPGRDTESRIQVLARQVVDCSAAGLRFGLRLPGREISPASGQPQAHRCLSALALYPHG